MMRLVAGLAFLALAGALPAPAFAATMASARTLVVSETPADNLYAAGSDVTITAPLPADALVAGGTVTLRSPIVGDAMLAGGTVSVEKPVSGDLRAAGATLSVTAPVSGDLMLAGITVNASSTARDTRLVGNTVNLTGSGGPAVIYGSDIRLAGTIDGDVTVVASDRLSLADGTRITGTLHYDAPQQADIPATATVEKGVTYTGAASYLPTKKEAQTFALAGAGVFFLVRIIAAVIAAGLLAGLFPAFSREVASRAIAEKPARFLILVLLGFGIVFATPVLIFMLLVSFVGIGVALPLLAAYALLLMIAYLASGVIAGAVIARAALKRLHVSWRFAALGMLILAVIEMIPGLGRIIAGILLLASVGAIVSIAYGFAFGRSGLDDADA